ncbi:MAG: riboflavin synthase [Cyclobacteriaceae bacterium]|nr:riboflavin synthase [Cyclobacteriaceae bacterium]
MFTGIVEAMGVVRRMEAEGTNRHFLVESPISHELRVDQSLSHNGVCLTVTRLEPGGHWVTAVQETLVKSNLGDLKSGDPVNLERSMPASGRFDGHIVQGHVDTTAVIKAIHDEKGSWRFDFEHPAGGAFLTVEKGSVCVNGISLTCFNCTPNSFSVAIIPFTYTHTNLGTARLGGRVNLEFDILGKYIQRLLSGQSKVA